MIDPRQKICGILVPTFALRGKNDLGIGDTGAMCEAVSFCARNYISVLQVLPINETGEDNSPYNAISSIALDPVLLTMTPDKVPGLTQKVLNELASPDLTKSLKEGAIKYTQVKKLKISILKAAFKNIDADKNYISQLDNFIQNESSWLDAYTLFRLIMEKSQSKACWPMWENNLQSYDSAKKWYQESAEYEELKRERRFWAYVQWVAFRQWDEVHKFANENKVQLMGDIPFGVSRYSADVWEKRELFDLNWSGGAPPETFFQGDPFTAKWGQNWGLPLYHWPAHENENFAWWKRRVEKVVQVFHHFRIDHVLGFFRIYAFPWIPEDNYKFVDLNHDEAARITGGRMPHFVPNADDKPEHAQANEKQGQAILKVILQAAKDTGVVAEDLGMVPPYVRPCLSKLGIPGFAIPIFERNEEDRSFKAKELLPELSLSTYGTHDHMPIVSFYEDLVTRWHGENGHEAWLDVQRLMKFLGMDENNPPNEFSEKLYEAFVQSLLETSCWLAVFMITDLFATKQRFNLPGTAEASNWSQRLEAPFIYFEQTEPYKSRIALLREMIVKTKRSPL